MWAQTPATRSFWGKYAYSLFEIKRKRLQFKTLKSPALRGFVGGPGRKRHRAFILCFYRTGGFPARFPIGGAKAGTNSADACLGCRDATLAPEAAHSGSQWRTRRLHLHLRSLCLFLTKLLGILAQAHAGLFHAKRIHLPQQDILLCCVERIAPALLGVVTLAERQLQRVAGSILRDVVVGIDVEPVIVFVREDKGSTSKLAST